MTSWKDDKSHKRAVRAVIKPDRVDKRELVQFASATARNTTGDDWWRLERHKGGPKSVHPCSAGR